MHIIVIIIAICIVIAILKLLFSSPGSAIVTIMILIAIIVVIIRNKVLKTKEINNQEEEKDEYKLNLDLLDKNQISPQKTKQEVETEKYIQTDSFYTKVAGVSFGNTQSILPHLNRGMSLEFFREPTNPYDSDAIRIECQGKAIGHLPAHVSTQLAPKIDSGNTYITGKIKEITGGGSKEYYGCNIEVFVWENQSEKIYR